MRLITDAVEELPVECRDLAGNALLNIAAEAVAQDVGCAEAGRIFARLPTSWRAACSRRSQTQSGSTPSTHDLSDRSPVKYRAGDQWQARGCSRLRPRR